MNYFNDPVQNEFKADFRFHAPHQTPTPCKKPVFTAKYMHRIAEMKDYHLGSPGDIDEGGLPGWVSKFICTGCGKKFKINKERGFFYPDKKD